MSIQAILMIVFAAAGGLISPASAGIRLVVPQAPFSQASDKALAILVQEFNRLHEGGGSEFKVELLRRGENFSSLKEVVAAHLAGDLPELASVETSELPALRKMNIPRPIGLSSRAGAKGEADALPFRTMIPILVADQEMLFRVRANPDRLPASWPALIRLAELLAQAKTRHPGRSNAPDRAGDSHALALPLQGPLGLWIFEAIAGRPLWQRETGGIRSNRALAGTIAQLQGLLDRPGIIRPEDNWERAVQSFIDRRAPLLVTSLDMLPYLARQTTFRWTAALLPQFTGGPSMLEGGSSLIATQDTPAVRAFLRFLYSKENTARWLGAGGFVPPRESVSHPSSHPSWKEAFAAQPAYFRLIGKPRKLRPRTTDTEVVRAHSEWIQALRLLFAEASRRLPTETVFTQMDSHLTPR